MPKFEVIKGDWMRDGFLDGRGRLTVEIINGKAYDADAPRMIPDKDRQVRLDADGCLRAWGQSTAFCPDSGEIKRVGGGLFDPETGA